MLYYADKLKELDAKETTRGMVETLRRIAGVYHHLPDSPYSAALATHAELVGAAVALGELHQAIADQLNPSFDEVFPELDRLAEAGILVGRCIYRSVQLLEDEGRAGFHAPPPGRGHTALPSSGAAGHKTPPYTGATGHNVTRASRVAPPHAGAGGGGQAPALRWMPMAELLESAAAAAAHAGQGVGEGRIQVRVPEGYAFYCLYPEMYLASTARALGSESGRNRHTVLGIRSIGTSLATLVAGALAERGLPAIVETLRPRGHPFDRYIETGPALRQRLEEAAGRGDRFLIVDEGPGLTCSSFLSVCSALDRLGVEEERVAILSAWRGAPSIYASEEGRSRWQRLRVFYTDAAYIFEGWRALVPFVEQAVAPSLPETGNGGTAGFLPRIEDLSYGRWRERCYPSAAQWPVIHRAAERAKVLYRLPVGQGRGEGSPEAPAEEGIPILAKFVGLGDYGREKYERARILAESGFGPPVLGLAYGFLLYRYLEESRPMAASDLSPSLLRRMAEYYAFVAGRFSRSPGPRFEQLAEVVLVNAREALRLDASEFVAAWRSHQQAIDGLPLVLVDGRPQPHEWLQGGSGEASVFLKADSSDHFRDHTLVGEQSILWDLAGASEEWEMDEAAREDLLEQWELGTGDRQAARLLDFYRAAYLAFRVAALHYAIHSTDEEEIRRSLQHELWKYSQRLTSLLTQSRPVGGIK